MAPVSDPVTLPLTLSPPEVAPLADQIEAQLRVLIYTGRLAPGDKLPAAQKLAGQLGVHRNTVEGCYKKLADDMLLTRQRGGGTHVANPPSIHEETRRTITLQLLHEVTRVMHAYAIPPNEMRNLVLADANLDPFTPPSLRVAVVARNPDAAAALRDKVAPLVDAQWHLYPTTLKDYRARLFDLAFVDREYLATLKKRSQQARKTRTGTTEQPKED